MELTQTLSNLLPNMLSGVASHLVAVYLLTASVLCYIAVKR